MMIKKTNAATVRRRGARLQHFPDATAWTGENERGWFRAPRTMPLILGLMASKGISGAQDPSRVYLELLARHVDEGVILMGSEEEHAYAAGYDGPRGVRTWRERMTILQDNGFIRRKSVGGRTWVLLVHPSKVIEDLRGRNLVPEKWWEVYCDRQAETGELPREVPPSTAASDTAPATPAVPAPITAPATAQEATMEGRAR